MRAASIFRRAGKYFVHAQSCTVDGLWVLCSPVLVVSEDEGDAALGREILVALGGSRMDVPAPHDAKRLVAPLLAISGARSWNAFAKDAECVEISEARGSVTLVPTRNLGPKGGFKHLEEQVFATPKDPARLGALAVEVLRVANEGSVSSSRRGKASQRRLHP